MYMHFLLNIFIFMSAFNYNANYVAAYVFSIFYTNYPKIKESSQIMTLLQIVQYIKIIA